MTTYTDIFGGGTIYPAEPTFLSLTFSTDQTLVWPIEDSVGGDGIVAKIIELHPSTAGLSVALDDARQVSTGFTALFYNAEADTVTITDQGGNTILTVASGEAWQIYLRDNSTANGTWRTFEQGAGTSTANAASLAGAGLKAITTTLNTKMDPVTHGTDYTIVNADRATVQVWTGGSGTFTLPDPATVGEDWYVVIKNSGSGSVTVTPPSGTIDGSASLIYAVDESSFIYTDGTNFFTVGLGQAVNAVFDFISINVGGTGDYTLSGAELNRIAYELTGVLTGNRNIIVPASVQQYWINNQTSGAFTLTVKTAAGTGEEVAQGAQRILYCDGTNVVPAESVVVTTPVTVSQGGTGITSGTSGGVPYFSSATTMASSAALAANQIVLGGGAGATPATLGSLGTTTTLLHGNAAGAPTFGAVSLANDVTGTFTDGQRFPDGSPAAPGMGFASEDTGFTVPSAGVLGFVVAGILKGSWSDSDSRLNMGASNLNFAASGVAGPVYHGFNVGGDPEGSVTAEIGSIYPSDDGGQQQGLYFKQSGTGNTGWRQAMLGRNAWTNVTSAGATAGTTFNVTSITHTAATGIYQVNFTQAYDTSPVAIACPRETGRIALVSSIGTASVTITTTDLTGTPTDGAFAVFVAQTL